MDPLLETRSVSNTDAEIHVVNAVNYLMLILSENDLFLIKTYPSEDAPGLQKLNITERKDSDNYVCFWFSLIKNHQLHRSDYN